MAIATLSIDIVAKLATLTQDLDKAVHLNEKAAKEVQEAWRKTGETFKEAGKLLGEYLSIRAIQEFVQSAIDAQDHLHDLAAKTQLSVEQIGALGFAASQAGANIDEVTTSIGKFNQTIAKAAAGDKDSKALFEVLKINVRDANGALKDGQALLIEVAERFDTFAEGPKKAALAAALFSKGYQAILPLLADGASSLRENTQYFEKFGGVSTQSTLAADKFNDTIGKIKLIAQGTRNTLVNEIIDPLQAVADAFLKAREESNKSVLADGFKVLFQTVAVLGANVVFVLGGIGREIGALAAQFATIFTGEGWANRFTAISDAVKEDGKRARAELDALEQRIMGIGKDAAAAGKSAADIMSAAIAASGGTSTRQRVEAPNVPGNVPAATKQVNAIDELTQRYRELFEAEMAVDGTQKEMAKAQSILADPKYASATAAQKQAILDYAAGIHSLKVARDADNKAIEEALQHDKLLGDEIAAITKAVEDQNKAFAALLASTPTATFDALIAKEEDLRERLKRGQITVEQFGEALNKIWNIDPDPTLKAIDELHLAVQDFAGEVDTMLGAGLQALLEGHFKSIGDAFKRMLETMAIKALETDLMNKLFGPQGQGGARQGGGWIDALISLGSSVIGGGAGGGAAEAGSIAAGSNGSWDMIPQAANSSSYVSNVNVQVASGVTRNELAALVPTIQQQVTSSVMQTMRRPGFSGG